MAGNDDSVVLEVGGHEVTLSHPDKVFFPERGETKLDLVRYYEAVAEPLLATMGGRPVLLQRFRDGATGEGFFQKRVPKNAPPWLQTTVVSTVNGTPSDAMVVADIGHVAWAANLACLGFHVWPTRAGDASEGEPDPSAPSAVLALAPVERGPIADELRIDLDPTPGVDFPMLREAATEVKQLFDEIGIAAFPKTTGNRGIHVYVHVEDGRWSSYDVRAGAVAVARELERRRPDLLTAAWWKEERGTRVFVDFNQNAPHKTVFGAWSVRARAGAQVSTPFAWDELEGIHPDELTIANVPARLAANGDPWAAMYDDPQPLEPMLERYASDLAAGMQDAPWPPVYPKMPNEPPRVAPSRAKKA
ncbi:MAG: non-homologous end-joining DNA ligase [Actinomycetota bacterium]|nr:ATP-dependent DNA ligase [Acidimicrobiia bacterium]MDQ3293336.1 non-homologous end-joining DNA ligase [Actinomycetota bacterium]